MSKARIARDGNPKYRRLSEDVMRIMSHRDYWFNPMIQAAYQRKKYTKALKLLTGD